MSQTEFTNAALVLLGHGTTLNEASAAPVYQHAAELRRRGIFAEVREGFWKQEPRLGPVLEGLTAKRVFLVPLFISEGYFCENVIPRALGFSFEPGAERGRRLHRHGQTLFYGRPVGSHENMTGVLLARASEVLRQFPFPRAPRPKDVTFFIAGHGTEQDAKSRAAVDRQVELIRARDIYAAVHAIFLDEEPRIPACFALAQTRNLVVVPFFISDGLHVAEDIPILLGEPERLVRARIEKGQPSWRNPSEKQGKRVWYSPAVGTEPSLAEVILERVREAAAWGPPLDPMGTAPA